MQTMKLKAKMQQNNLKNDKQKCCKTPQKIINQNATKHDKQKINKNTAKHDKK